jgi:tripartite ATP-independent transporter DctM subunit
MEILAVCVLIIAFLTLLYLGIPVAWSIITASLLSLIILMPNLPSLTAIVQRMATGIDSFALIAIPFFILSGELMTSGGIAQRLIAFAKSLVGFLPGGLAIINIIAAMLMGSIAGSAMASASAMGGILGPEMEKDGYTKGFGVAVNVTSATTGLIIPPSNVLIVYSLASGGTSVAALFLAGYIPGIITGILLMVVALIWAKKNNIRAKSSVSFRQLSQSFLDSLPSLLLLFLVIGGIVSGIFTATEASAIAVIYTLLLGIIYKKVTFRNIASILLKASETSAMVLFLICASMAMSWVLSFENIPEHLGQSLMGISSNKIIILLFINLTLLLVGTFMDMTPAVLIFTPIFLPVALSIGIDPVQFGIMMVINLCIGLCTPPVGSVLFVGIGVANTTIKSVIRPLIPFFLAMLTALLLTTYIPELTLWLPSIFGT